MTQMFGMGCQKSNERGQIVLKEKERNIRKEKDEKSGNDATDQRDAAVLVRAAVFLRCVVGLVFCSLEQLRGSVDVVQTQKTSLRCSFILLYIFDFSTSNVVDIILKYASFNTLSHLTLFLLTQPYLLTSSPISISVVCTSPLPLTFYTDYVHHILTCLYL